MAWTLVLASVRLWALLRVQASWRALIGASWEPISAALALALAGVACWGSSVASELPDSLTMAIVGLALEFMLGSVIGLLASLPGWALCGASEIASLELGGTGRAASLRALMLALALAAGLTLGLHRPIVAVMLGSLTRLPLAEPLAWASAVEPTRLGLPAVLVRFSTLALALATPVMLIRMVVEIGVAALARGPDPAAALLAGLSPGLRFAGAALALVASWSAYPQTWARGLG